MAILLLVTSIYGLIQRNIILMLICLELILLAISLITLYNSISLDDMIGQVFSLYIIALAGGESAIGLAILVVFYRLRGTISIQS